jgi:hypothetical protein
LQPFSIGAGLAGILSIGEKIGFATKAEKPVITQNHVDQVIAEIPLVNNEEPDIQMNAFPTTESSKPWLADSGFEPHMC